MNLSDLLKIVSILEWARHTESCADCMMDEEIDEAIELVYSEIKKFKSNEK